MSDPRCPICSRKAEMSFSPFCSTRCQDEDLRRWLAGEYRIPGRPQDESEDESDQIKDAPR
jgi:endogenous inhibitor of DNA gyrase (YacG/DUF329 family)